MHSYDHNRLISLSQLAEAVPPDGVSLATIDRWATKGLRGVKLRTQRDTHQRMTSWVWYLAFVEAVTTRRDEQQADRCKKRLAAGRVRAARKELDRLGAG